ncbi:MAG: class I SAM-dependent methyltransferase [Planctomycetota bacterium]
MSLSSKVKFFTRLARAYGVFHGQLISDLFDRKGLSAFEQTMRTLGVYRRRPLLPKVDPAHLLQKETSIRLTQFASGDWQVSSTELGIIVQLAAEKKPEHIFEFGTFDGRTSLNLSQNCPSSLLTTLDLPPEDTILPPEKTAGIMIRHLVQEGKATQLYGNSQTFDFSPYWGQCDFVFIDAGHGYTEAATDTRTTLKLIEGRDAVVVWHDYAAWAGVTQAAEEVRDLVASPIELVWVNGTRLAVLRTLDGVPLKLKG